MGPPTQEIAVIGCKTLVLSMGGYGSTTWRALSDQGPLQGCLMVNTFFVRKGFELVRGFVLVLRQHRLRSRVAYFITQIRYLRFAFKQYPTFSFTFNSLSPILLEIENEGISDAQAYHPCSRS
jgi:hypothetical protein